MLRRLLILAALIWASAIPDALAQVQPDRNLLMPELTKEWKTLSTAHFRIHHETGNADYAQNLAAIAERVHGKLSVWLGWQPLAPTEVVLLDTFDTSNGHATPLPYNSISIYMNAPVDGELMDQTPWLEMVFTHEYVHILHLDMAYGGPQAMRNVFGRSTDLFTLMDFPQLFAPSWVAEGIAVYGESKFSEFNGNESGYGRLNSSFYDAMMRMEVQRGLYSLTELSYNSGYRWPYGQVYLYGAYFFKFAEARYGRDAVTNYIRVYGSNLIPFRMQKRSQQIFGKSAEEVWGEYQQYLTQHFAPQLAVLKQQSQFITKTIHNAPYSSSALAAAGNGDLYFLHDDNSSRPQIRRLGADGSNVDVVDGRGVQDIDWHDKAGLLLSKFAVCDNTNVYADIYLWKPGMSSAKRQTHCGRYTFAKWRPDGGAIAAIQSSDGLSRLVLLDVSGKKLGDLAALPMGDVLGHIDWSPDGATIVASVQRKKAGWNLELLDVNTQQWQALTGGSHLVQRPQFSADGREIYFLSDHAKVWNLRRLKLGSNRIDTLSNTVSAFTEVVQMPDRSFRLVEYTAQGKAIVALELNDASSMPGYAALDQSVPAADASGKMSDEVHAAYNDVSDYSPWSTLRPHSWFPLLDSSAGQVSYAGVMLNGSDALNFHQWNAIPLYYYEQKQLGGLARYSFYNKLDLSAQREFFILGNAGSGNQYRDDEVRYQALLHHSLNTLDSSTYFAAGVANEAINTQVIQGAGVAQSYNNRITGGIARFDNSRFYKNSISYVDGRNVQFLSESYDLLGGSDFSGRTSRIDWHEYIALGGNHALHFRLLRAEGDSGIRPYHMGGVSELLSKIGGNTGLGRRDFPLRGYPSGLASLSGSNMGLFSAEWKIPLGYHYDGWFVPPLGAGRESLTLFADSGDAWNQGETIEVKTGIGVEWSIEMLLGYDLLKVATTLGYAHGVDEGGEKRLYLRVALPFF